MIDRNSTVMHSHSHFQNRATCSFLWFRNALSLINRQLKMMDHVLTHARASFTPLELCRGGEKANLNVQLRVPIDLAQPFSSNMGVYWRVWQPPLS